MILTLPYTDAQPTIIGLGDWTLRVIFSDEATTPAFSPTLIGLADVYQIGLPAADVYGIPATLSDVYGIPLQASDVYGDN